MKSIPLVVLLLLLVLSACSTPASPQKKGAGNTTHVSIFRLDDLLFPPPDTMVVSADLGLYESQLMVIPQGYKAASATMDYAFRLGNPAMEVNCFIGQTPFTVNCYDDIVGWKAFRSLQDQQSYIPVSVQGPAGDSVSREAGLSLSMKVLCVAVR